MTPRGPATARFEECPTCHHRIYESQAEAAGTAAALREALAELSYVAGRIHAGGSQDDLDRFEQAMIGAGMALRQAAIAAAYESREKE